MYGFVHWVGHSKHVPDFGVAAGIHLVRLGYGQFTGLSASRVAPRISSNLSGFDGSRGEC